ncbi:molybdopterin dehydrogenase [Paenibacillus sp. H1-7]|uniref:FAD binding domain-containing protein n=1 Tax=Paenibacillus sp. H1-7 TaxID=2282849 RepID=UPI001EF7B04A|nr:FAD binding domain-containing protein [Paenibacillus sp. H1-7]ULL14589.1 molybdopterin dehydrogenase [Paenibacillus sp. H1-7]
MAVGSYEMYSVPRVWQPSDLAEAWELRRALGAESCFVAGGTLLRTQWEAGAAAMPRHLISLERISALKGIRVIRTSPPERQVLRIGPLTTLEGVRRNPYSKLLAEACRTIAAPSIRHQGTIGGNVASGIGDAIPALLVLGAELVWFDGGECVTESLEDWLAAAKDSGRNAHDHRILTGLVANGDEIEGGSDEERKRRIVFYHKVGRREAFVPSLITAAGSLRLHEDGRVATAKLAVGGGASTAQRLHETEALLEGKELTPEMMRRVLNGISSEWKAFRDAFATAEYRRTAAANLIVSELWSARRRNNGKRGGESDAVK